MVRLPQPENIPCIFVTLLVLKLVRFKLVRLVHVVNIEAIAVTLLVSKLDKSRPVKLEHPWNILLIYFTFEVLNELTFNFFNDLQFLNIPP